MRMGNLLSAPVSPAFRAGCVLLGLLVLIAGAEGTDAARKPSRKPGRKQSQKQRIHTLRTRLKSLSKKKVETQAQLRVIKRAEVRIADQLNQSYERLEQAQVELQGSEVRLHAAERQVTETQRRLDEAEQRLALQRRRFGRRIASSYKEGPVTYLDVVLGSRNLSDFLDRQYYVGQVMGQDAGLLRGLREAQQAVLRQRQLLLQKKQRLAAAHQDNLQRVAQVAYQASEREKLLEALKRDRALQEQELQELEDTSNDVQQSLEAEVARRQANPGSYRNLPRWSGGLSRPANGPITSRFGYRSHPILGYRRLHAGVDIGAGYGSPVFAASEGEVFFASWRGGYGKCIIVLHGGGMSTLYGHLSRIDVAAGQHVRRGQRIGAVGSTGLSSGPHLHFEVRRNGVPVSPPM
ncbi:MAG: Murein DD-endopeptidase MepM and murein hydrolase activator NlpD, containing LysM domain [Armatimonadetes bacterium]|jgi:murein DD-endopeptidase MepM/ murein hydrolase activator NlpD|nr:Murein DD-endopeptidase MepM and murein hydrolase activator NlpD, containing LysM domain [Armatimonadota bacterium]